MLLALILAYFGALALLSNVSARPWALLGVEQGPWPFMDLDNVLTAVECSARGLDPLVENPCDRHGRPMNYPRIWLVLRHLGADTTWLLAGGVVIAAVAIAVVLAISPGLTAAEGFALGAATCSPSFMLLVERGNVDAVVLAVVAVAAWLSASASRARRAAGYGAVLAAAALKLFPIAASALALSERRRRDAFAVVAALAGAFGLLVAATWRDVAQIARTVPRNWGLGYGAAVLPDGLARLGGGSDAAGVWPSVAAALVAAAGVAWGGWVRRRRRASPAWTASWRGALFAAGAAVFVATFVIGHNWAYRLGFLVLTLPHLLVGSREASDVAGRFARVVRCELVVLFLCPLAPSDAPAVFLLWVLGQGASWLLVFALAREAAAGFAPSR